MANKLSIVTITKNEEANIRSCLESIKWADEIIVIDDYSKDSTVNICREYTDNIFLNEFLGFGEQKQFGVDKAKGEWVLVLDADELVSLDLRNEIMDVVSSDTPFNAFNVTRKNFYAGKQIKHCGWNEPVIKLFRKSKAKFDLRKVHEGVEVSGGIGFLNHSLLHYSYTGITQHMEKLNLYTTLEAKVYFDEGLRINPFNYFIYFFVKPLFVFFRKFLLMAGFLDGREGCIISFFTALTVLFDYAKLCELQINKLYEEKHN